MVLNLTNSLVIKHSMSNAVTLNKSEDGSSNITAPVSMALENSMHYIGFLLLLY